VLKVKIVLQSMKACSHLVLITEHMKFSMFTLLESPNYAFHSILSRLLAFLRYCVKILFYFICTDFYLITNVPNFQIIQTHKYAYFMLTASICLKDN
jgi:hypothetical protein